MKASASLRNTAQADGPQSGGDTVGAADRALQILDAFGPDDRSLGLSTLAERTGLPKSTVLRLVGTLMNRSYIRATSDGQYRLGPAVLRLMDTYQCTVQPIDIIRPTLEALMDESGESASFNVREGDLQVCLYRVDSRHALRDHVRIGQVFPLAHGCAGHVLRAFSGEQGPSLEETRQRVVVTTHGEQFPGTSGMAVPVFSFNQSLAGAMILSGPTSRFDDETVRRMESLLLKAGASLTRELGGNPLLFDIRRREMGLDADSLSTARKRKSKAGS